MEHDRGILHNFHGLDQVSLRMLCLPIRGDGSLEPIHICFTFYVFPKMFFCFSLDPESANRNQLLNMTPNNIF